MGIARRSGRVTVVSLVALLLVGATGLIGYNQGLSILSISQTLEPQRVFIKGSGITPETATVTLKLEAPQRSDRLMADVILVVDRSASFEIDQATDAARRIIDRLGVNDRVGLVSFATEATLDARLTPVSEAASVRDVLGKLVAEGKTALGEGMAVATDELVVSGRPQAALVQILLTDGRSNYGRDPLEEARKAADRNVVIHSVAIGRFVNRDLLTQIAETTGGQFFSAFNDAIVDQMLRVTVPTNEPVATKIEVVETLSRGIAFQESLENPPTRNTSNSDGTTTLAWQRSSLQAGETWTIRYSVSGSEEGTLLLHRSPSYVQYTDFRNRQIQKDLPVDLALIVRPRSVGVNADFRFEPDNPTIFDDITFTDKSTVETGRITRWLWDFGDGKTSTDQNPIHRYAVDGAYRVTLGVTSDQSVEGANSKTITVFTPKVSIRRKIDTFIPVKQTIPGQTFQVTLDIEVNEKLNGLGIDENLPTGWKVTSVENGSASVRVDEAQWLFSEVLDKGAIKRIVYEVAVPAQNQSAGVFPIEGSASSASPQITQPTTGDNQVEVLSGFPVSLVVAHWNTGSQTLDLRGFPSHKIDLNQILRAISWWRDGLAVPSTAAASGLTQTIDLKTMQQLVAYWLTGTSVFDPLPQEK